VIESELISRKILDAKASKFSCQESSVQFSSVPMAGKSLYLVFWKSIHLNAMQWSR
jgi:hypothetical protein